jgi:hypothetical protein
MEAAGVRSQKGVSMEIYADDRGIVWPEGETVFTVKEGVTDDELRKFITHTRSALSSLETWKRNISIPAWSNAPETKKMLADIAEHQEYFFKLYDAYLLEALDRGIKLPKWRHEKVALSSR